jgi:putative lipase involved disintegration of autophagic bodies
MPKHGDTCKSLLLLLRNTEFDKIVHMETILVSEAETIIMSLKPKNTTGYDGIPSKILKYCVHFISKPLTYIYNCSLTTGICPERCKFAMVRPTSIYKEGGKKRSK